MTTIHFRFLRCYEISAVSALELAEENQHLSYWGCDLGHHVCVPSGELT